MDFISDWDQRRKAVEDHPSFKDFTIKNYRSANGTDGVAFSCDIFFCGHKCGTAINSGSGGPDRVRINPIGDNDSPIAEWVNLEEAGASDFEPWAVVLDALLTKHGV